MCGFVEYWTEELGGVHRIDPRLRGMSALEVTEIYLSSLVGKPLEEIERLYTLSRAGKEKPDWIASFKRCISSLLDEREAALISERHLETAANGNSNILRIKQIATDTGS